MADPGLDDRTQEWDRVPPPPPGPPLDDDAAPPTPPREPRWRRVSRALGELLVTLGVVALLFVVYEVYVTDLLNGHRQDQLAEQVHQSWAKTPAGAAEVEPAVGQPLAVLHVPRFGADWSRVVLEGTATDQLAQGPGHYEGTAMPGQQGNLALAGHRVTKGRPFFDAAELRPGDPIVVETADDWYVYRVLGDAATGSYSTAAGKVPGQEIVAPTDLAVISPTPDGAADAAPTGAYLTITTCNPKYSARQRLVVHALLDGAAIPKSEAPNGPPALRAG